MSGSERAPASSPTSSTPASTVGALAVVPATRADNPGTLPATATAAAVNVPRRRKFRRLRLPRQPSVPCSDTSPGSGLMVDPPFGSSGVPPEPMVILDDDSAKEFLIPDFLVVDQVSGASRLPQVHDEGSLSTRGQPSGRRLCDASP